MRNLNNVEKLEGAASTQAPRDGAETKMGQITAQPVVPSLVWVGSPFFAHYLGERPQISVSLLRT